MLSGFQIFDALRNLDGLVHQPCGRDVLDGDAPGKNALLRCMTAGFTSPTFGHESFAVTCPLALSALPSIRFLFIGPQLQSTLPLPRSVALPQLRFSTLAVTSSRQDFHPQECAHAGRTGKKGLAIANPLKKFVCSTSYRFENWKERRAFARPYFLRSTTRLSRVRKPSFFRAERSSGSK
jgi:hypothetical protein